MHPIFRHHLIRNSRRYAQNISVTPIEINSYDEVSLNSIEKNEHFDSKPKDLHANQTIRVELSALLSFNIKKNSETEQSLLRWTKLIGHILPKQYREEWIGDVRESLTEYRRSNPPSWELMTIGISKFVLIFWALTKIKIQDLTTPPRKDGNPD